MKKLFAVYILSFIFNTVWENLHSVLYVQYKGGEITEAILLYAALADAIYVTIAVAFVRAVPVLRARPYLFLMPFFIALAIGIEWWALETLRWTYSERMPIIPFVHTGLSPTLQLAVTGGLTWWIVFARKEREFIGR